MILFSIVLERKDRSFTRFDGFKVKPHELENMLKQDSRIKYCVVSPYFDEEKMSTSLFKAREEFDEVADMDELYEYGAIPEQFREMVWDTIEGQLGDCTPMAKTKPSPNTPQDLFATAVYVVRNSKRWFN